MVPCWQGDSGSIMKSAISINLQFHKEYFRTEINYQPEWNREPGKYVSDSCLNI